MSFSENLKIKGEVTLTATSKDGEVRKEVVRNLVVNEGLQLIAAKLFDAGSLAYKNAFNVGTDTTDLVYFAGRKNNNYAYDISEIVIGTHDSPQKATDTYASQFNKGTKISKRWDNGKVDGVTPNNAFYVQADFDASAADTLIEDSTVVPIKECLLYASAYDSPLDSNPNRKLVARTKLINEEGFLKFSTDRLTVAWKLQIGV
tara:strand:+ start:699 stop:1307 length:609 start_codon:yes stop_codon:yes gene_type:complete